MARAYFINGETLVQVGNAVIGTQVELGLAEDQVRIIVNMHHDDIMVEAWGAKGKSVPEIQWMLGDVTITMNLVHFDRSVLDTCISESMGGQGVGLCARAGALLGGQVALGAAGNHFINLRMTSPVGGKPWTFPATHLTQSPVEMPLGAERSVVRLTWRAIPYTTDPYNGGLGAQGAVLWTYT